MKISEKWLRTWVDPSVDTQALCEQLTNLGLEVEGVENPYSLISGVVVAQIHECKPLDKASNNDYTLCIVNDGSEQYQVVCGSPNARVGLLTAYAQPGAVLADGTKIEAKQLRSEHSDGMLCSASELGISTDQSGLIEFGSDTEVGLPITQYFDLDRSNTIDIDLTPNRGDCLSIRGVAREIGVINRINVDEITYTNQVVTHEQELSIQLDDPSGCPRYLGRIFRDVKVTRTPDWMVMRLIECGLRPIDPIVDITNYVMLELGQPLHAFDLKNVQKGIVVRRSKSTDKLTMLDGQELEFKDEGTLLITDGETPLAIAGVMGGEVSGIQADTQDVFLECAYFAPDAIMGTARQFGFQTDASHRFERGVDPELQERAIERASELLVEIAQGRPGPITIAESREHVPDSKSVNLDRSRLALLVGESISDDMVEDILSRLGLTVKTSEQGWQVQVPPRRFDLNIEEDLVEEVCRVYGYNKIKPNQPSTSIHFESSLPRRSPYDHIRSKIASLGYLEVINYSFIDPDLNAQFGERERSIHVENPMSNQLSSMRQSLLPGLLDSCKYNLSRQQDTVRLFELGKCFRSEYGELSQPDYFALLSCGRRHGLGWSTSSQSIDFYDLKGDLEHILGERCNEVDYRPSSAAYLHPGQSAQVLLTGKAIGEVGRLHPDIVSQLELPLEVFVLELVGSHFTSTEVPTLNPVAPYPYVSRDLALLIEENISYSQLIDIVRLNMSDLLQDIQIFDLLLSGDKEAKKAGMKDGYKSVAIRLELQDSQDTLTEATVSNRISELVSVLSKEIGAQQR